MQLKPINNIFDTINRAVLDYIEENEDGRKKTPKKPITKETKFKNLKFDNLDIYQLSIRLEPLFEIALSDTTIESFKTVGDVCEAISVIITKENCKTLAQNLTREDVLNEVIQNIKNGDPSLKDVNITEQTSLNKDIENSFSAIINAFCDFEDKHQIDLTKLKDYTGKDGDTIGDICDYIYGYIVYGATYTPVSKKAKLQQGVANTRKKASKAKELLMQMKQKLSRGSK